MKTLEKRIDHLETALNTTLEILTFPGRISISPQELLNLEAAQKLLEDTGEETEPTESEGE